jgi:hypothetical protein
LREFNHQESRLSEHGSSSDEIPELEAPRELYCYECGTPWDPMELRCRGCGGVESADGAARPLKSARDDVRCFKGPWRLLPWPGQGTVGMFGGPGAGKSTLAALIRPTLWLTKEQVPKPVGSLFKRIWPDGFMPLVHTVNSAEQVRKALLSTVEGPVVLDSATALGLREGLLASHHLVEWAQRHNQRTLCIIQVTKSGQSAGFNEIPHLFDAIVNISPDAFGVRAWRATKSRWCDLGATYWSFNADGRVTTPDFPAAYSVEGAPGDYWLQPFPLKGGKWYGLLAAMASHELLKPKMASAAVRAPYMPTGFIEPMDVPERRRFAENHGLTWVTPEEVDLPEDDD